MLLRKFTYITRNLAIANRSRVNSEHTITTANFQGREFSTEKGRKHMGHLAAVFES